jgi:1-acyl-sn-glycerol-3-phosphate acyltransferase
MKNKFYKSLFRFCRLFVRCFTSSYSVCHLSETVEPAVYLVNHQNMRGPIVSMVWFDKPVHIWVLNVFCDGRTCFRQFYNYTFTKRFGLPKLLSAVIIFPVSLFVSRLMKSMRAIPVFRNSKSIVKTFRQSILALSQGQSLLICPSIDYTDTDSNIGEIYKGFLDLEKYYIKKNGNHLAFVPLHISKLKHCIYVGKAVYFTTEDEFKNEKANVYYRLKQEFSLLEKLMDK